MLDAIVQDGDRIKFETTSEGSFITLLRKRYRISNKEGDKTTKVDSIIRSKDEFYNFLLMFSTFFSIEVEVESDNNGKGRIKEKIIARLKKIE